MKDPKLKSIRLIPYRTAFTNSNHAYTFHVKHESQSVGIYDIATKVAANNKKYSTNEVAMLVEEFMEVVREAVIDGFVVTTPLFTVQLVANGTADATQFTQPMHHDDVNIYASFKQSEEMRKDIRQTAVEVSIQPDTYHPIIAGIEPAASKYRVERCRNNLVPGTMTIIQGRLLKLMGDDPAVGITLRPVDGVGEPVHIPPAMVYPNRPSSLQFLLPATIAEGEWEVTVTTQYGCGRRNVQQPRSTTFDERVTVVPINTPPE